MAVPLGSAKLKITAYSDGDYQQPVGEPFLVSINPDKYSHGYKICYTNPQPPGSPGASPRFNKIGTETVSFQLVFDATGVVPSMDILPPWDGITSEIERFKATCFNYYPKTHSPKFLKLVWGRLLFRGRLTSLDFNYTLFKPDGAPLRATVNASFIGYQEEAELLRQANKSSPDMTHLITVKAGDTLPLLCWNIYGTTAYYLEVARVNGLTEFRRLIPGTNLIFPPLQEATL